MVYIIKFKAMSYKDFCYITMYQTDNKFLCFIAHPNLCIQNSFCGRHLSKLYNFPFKA